MAVTGPEAADFDRERLVAEVRALLAQTKATDAYRAETVVSWLIEHRVVLCNHQAPAWQCDRDCPAYQTLRARYLGLRRIVNTTEGEP